MGTFHEFINRLDGFFLLQFGAVDVSHDRPTPSLKLQLTHHVGIFLIGQHMLWWEII